MRIGISTSVIQRGKTGVAQYVFDLLRAFLSNSSKDDFVLFVLEQDMPLFDFCAGKVQFSVVPERFRPAVRNILWHQTRLPALARSLRLDVLHVPSYRRLLWRRPCPLVATIHDLAPFHVAKKYDWKRMFYGRVVVRRLARRQNEIIAISENTACDIVRFFGIPRERITVIHNGLDHQRFVPSPPDLSPKLAAERFGLNSPFFLYLARLEHPGKNHVGLISAFEEFKAASGSNWLLVFGGSDWHGAQVIHNAIKNSKYAADIRCLGFVADDQLPDLYRSADVFVYPSLYEGFGMPPIETMACGCPVISSDRGSLGEVLGDAAAIVNPDDFHTIAKQMWIMATDDAARNRFRAAGLARAAHFDWNRTAAETLAVYRRAATRSHPPGWHLR